jgi:hypothetical protein
LKVDDDWLKQLGLNFGQNAHFYKGKGAVIFKLDLTKQQL